METHGDSPIERYAGIIAEPEHHIHIIQWLRDGAGQRHWFPLDGLDVLRFHCGSDRVPGKLCCHGLVSIMKIENKCVKFVN